MKSEKIDTKEVVIEFGRHRGNRIQRTPVNYLIWMVRNNTQQSDAAEAEMERRGTTIPQIEISGHGIDSASLRIRAQWHEHSEPNQGLHSWLVRAGWEAFQMKEEGEDRVEYLGVRWVFDTEGGWPLIKTVMPARKSK